MRIERIELPTITGMQTVNCFVIIDHGVTLVDAGEATHDSRSALLNQLKDLGLTLQDIDEILITHAHVDHIGGAGRIAQEANARIRLSNKVLPWTKNLKSTWDDRGAVIAHTLETYLSKEFFGFASAMYQDMKNKMFEIWDEIPQELIDVFDIYDEHIEIQGQRWKMFYAPGHSATQNCFLLESTGQMLSADMILKVTPTPVIEVAEHDTGVREKSILRMMQSYDKFRKIPMDVVYPGHFECLNNAHQIIDDQVARIQRRKEQTLEILRSGKTKLIDVFNLLYKGRIDLPAFNMLIGYIDLLESEGAIRLVQNNEEGSLRIFTV